MKFALRDYQQRCVDDAIAWFKSATVGDTRLYAAPTGTGKSVILLELQARLGEGCWIVAPKIEIIAGFLDKLGLRVPERESELIELARARRIMTPIRLRSGLLDGSLPEPAQLLFDEGHHQEASSWQDIHTLTGFAPAVAVTATPYRGTPRSTVAFREKWGEPIWVLTYPMAQQRGVISIPRAITWPLLDDDIIEVDKGELVASRVETETLSRLEHLVELCRPFVDPRYGEPHRWDRPTMFALPSRETARILTKLLNDSGLPANCVTGETSHDERKQAFAACVAATHALVQIDVVSEGVDLPIRRLIDAKPTLSPVKWLQQLGRITRPGGESEYICTNRNLLRHGYLLEGCLPRSVMVESQVAFKVPSKRAAARAVGLEAIGKFKANALPLTSGLVATGYAVSTTEDFKRVDYYVICHPCREDLIWAKKVSKVKPNGELDFGAWVKCQPPDDLTGFASTPPSSMSDKQKKWWLNAAARHGLKPDPDVNRRVFSALPVLADLRERL